MAAEKPSKADEKASSDRHKALDTALAQIERQFGKGAVIKMSDKQAQVIEVIPTGSVALDMALGIGGLPRGRIVEIYGPESSGKTTLTLHAIASAHLSMQSMHSMQSTQRSSALISMHFSFHSQIPENKRSRSWICWFALAHSIS